MSPSLRHINTTCFLWWIYNIINLLSFILVSPFYLKSSPRCQSLYSLCFALWEFRYLNTVSQFPENYSKSADVQVDLEPLEFSSSIYASVSQTFLSCGAPKAAGQMRGDIMVLPTFPANQKASARRGGAAGRGPVEKYVKESHCRTIIKGPAMAGKCPGLGLGALHGFFCTGALKLLVMPLHVTVRRQS